jgi:4-hydroxybenzoyl-CoA thioesterase
MLTVEYPIRLEWGACDAAGITFYPNYFRWFDAAAWRLFETAGFFAGALMHERGVFLPIVDARARFHRPGWLEDDLVLESAITEWRDRFFLVRHLIRRAETLILEGSELRCWAVRHPGDPRRMLALPIPPEFRLAFGGPD